MSVEKIGYMSLYRIVILARDLVFAALEIFVVVWSILTFIKHVDGNVPVYKIFYEKMIMDCNHLNTSYLCWKQ